MAFFPDSFDEPNGVATLSREFAAYAESRQLPFCYAHAGQERRTQCHGSVTALELNRSWTSFLIDKDFYCDPLLLRHRDWAVAQLQEFKPDLIHITGPGDFGVLGFWVAHTPRIPLVASWHTNLHEYASKRLQKALSWVPHGLGKRIGATVESLAFDALMRFYRLPHVVLAPNQEMVDQVHRWTQRPAYLMAHGVNTTRFSPQSRRRTNGPFTIGYVGRLTPEKNLRWFGELERTLVAAGQRDFRLVFVGDGSEQAWLKTNLQFAEFPGILRGDDLAAAFADMDVFAFPSRTDTFGLVVLEAMASGVPVIVGPETGSKVQIQNGVSGIVTEDFTSSVLRLMHDENLRQKMSSAAREFACSRSWDAVFDGIYGTYRRALQTEDVRRRIAVAR